MFLIKITSLVELYNLSRK